MKYEVQISKMGNEEMKNTFCARWLDGISEVAAMMKLTCDVVDRTTGEVVRQYEKGNLIYGSAG